MWGGPRLPEEMPEETPDPTLSTDSLEEPATVAEVVASTDARNDVTDVDAGREWPGPLEEPPLYPT